MCIPILESRLATHFLPNLTELLYMGTITVVDRAVGLEPLCFAKIKTLTHVIKFRIVESRGGGGGGVCKHIGM